MSESVRSLGLIAVEFIGLYLSLIYHTYPIKGCLTHHPCVYTDHFSHLHAIQSLAVHKLCNEGQHRMLLTKDEIKPVCKRCKMLKPRARGLECQTVGVWLYCSSDMGLHILDIIMPPFEEERAYCFAHVGRSVGPSVRPSVTFAFQINIFRTP